MAARWNRCVASWPRFSYEQRAAHTPFGEPQDRLRDRDEHRPPLEEVGQQFSVTRERIRQIEAKALRKLKHPSRSRKMRSFLDQ